MQVEADEPESRHPAFSRLSILRTLWKRKVRIGVVWVLAAAVGIGIVRMLPAVYLSEAVVLIDTQKIPEKFVSATVASDVEERIASIRQMLLSGGELKKIIENFGLYKEQRKTHFEEEILEMMRKDISITLESVGSGRDNKRTAAFRIGYQGSDPLLVMRVANRLTDLYVEQNMKTREGQAEGTSAFLETQLSEAKKRLDELEASVSTYKLQHNGELPQQEQSLASALTRLQTELEVNRDAINRTQQTRVILEGNLSAMEVTLSSQTQAWEQAQRAAARGSESLSFNGQPAPPAQKKTYETLQEQLALLRSRYSDNHPDVIRMKAEIERLKRLDEQRQAEAETVAKNSGDTPKSSADTTKGPAQAEKSPQSPGGTARTATVLREPPDLARTREQVAGLKAQIVASNKELEDRQAEQKRIVHDLEVYQHRLENLPVREQEMARITRDYEMSKVNYKSLQDKKIAAEMALDMERRQQSERFTVLDQASLPQKPIKPNRPALYAVAVGVGLIIALALGFTAELMQNVVLGEWELPEGAPILARLPYIEIQTASDQMKSRSRGRWFGLRKGLASTTIVSLLGFGSRL